MTSGSIRLHKKFGLNPTLSVCFYCGEETGEITLLGAAYKGEAPKHMCTSLEPCEKCKEKLKDDVILVEAVQNDSGKPSPTGRWIAINKQYIKNQNSKICYISPQTYEELTKQFK